MIDKPDSAPPPDRLSLSRWSRRKLEAARAQSAPAREVAPAPVAPGQQAPQPAPPSAPEASAALPPIESLSIESEFAPFFKPGIPESTRRAALKQLFRDPRFNIMDGLDVYIDDYSKPDPLPEGWLEKMNQVARLGDYQPPKPEEAEEAEAVASAEAAPELPAPSEPTAPDETLAPPESLAEQGTPDPSAPWEPPAKHER